MKTTPDPRPPIPDPHVPRPIWESTVRDSPGIVWYPTPEYVTNSRLWAFMQGQEIKRFSDLHERSVTDPEWFWDATVKDLDLKWQRPYTRVLDMSRGPEWPQWFVGGQYNYVYDAVDKHALNRPSDLALLWEGEDGEERALTYSQLWDEVFKAANALSALGIERGDRVGIFMPMMPGNGDRHAGLRLGLGAIYTPSSPATAAPAVAARLGDAARSC